MHTTLTIKYTMCSNAPKYTFGVDYTNVAKLSWKMKAIVFDSGDPYNRVETSNSL